jgi:hypothetical protein
MFALSRWRGTVRKLLCASSAVREPLSDSMLHCWCPSYRYCTSLEHRPLATKAATSLIGFMLGDILAQRLEGVNILDIGRVLHLGMYGLLIDGPIGHMWYKCALNPLHYSHSLLCSYLAMTGSQAQARATTCVTRARARAGAFLVCFEPSWSRRSTHLGALWGTCGGLQEPSSPSLTPPTVCRWLDGTCDKTFAHPTGTAAVATKTSADQLIWAPIMTCVFFAFLKGIEGHPELILPTIQAKVLPTIAANYVIWPAAHVMSFKYVPSHHRILYNNVIAIFWNCYLSIVASGGCVIDTTMLAGIDAQTSSHLAGLHDVAMRVQSTMPANGFWVREILDLNNPIGSSAAHLAAKGASSPFVESVMHMQAMAMGR